MAEKKQNRLATLVRDASGELAPEAPLRRGRGLEGMLAGGQPEDMSTSTQADKTSSKQTSAADGTRRVVKSYRIRDDLAHRIEVLAATERRKIYEVVEEALERYLQAHVTGQAK